MFFLKWGGGGNTIFQENKINILEDNSKSSWEPKFLLQIVKISTSGDD